MTAAQIIEAVENAATTAYGTRDLDQLLAALRDIVRRGRGE